MNKIPFYLGVPTFLSLMLAFGSCLENINYWNLALSKNNYFKTKFIPKSLQKFPIRANSRVNNIYLKGAIGSSEEELSLNYTNFKEKDIIDLLQKSDPIIVWYNPKKPRAKITGRSFTGVF